VPVQTRELSNVLDGLPVPSTSATWSDGVKAFHNRQDLTDFAQSWPKPLVVIRGDQDGAPPHPAAAETASSPLGELHVIENAGHYTSLEQPSKV
jgi:pimeloyl-ACP methyl ester carboxylesterase